MFFFQNFFRLPGPKGLVGNTGTYDSLIDGFSNQDALTKLRKQMNRGSLPHIGPTLKRYNGSRYLQNFSKYALPFPGSDATVVRDTQYYYKETDRKDEIVQFGAYFCFSSYWSVLSLYFFTALLKSLIGFSWGRNLLKKVISITIDVNQISLIFFKFKFSFFFSSSFKVSRIFHFWCCQKRRSNKRRN